jgi:hypothetical protein
MFSLVLLCSSICLFLSYNLFSSPPFLSLYTSFLLFFPYLSFLPNSFYFLLPFIFIFFFVHFFKSSFVLLFISFFFQESVTGEKESENSPDGKVRKGKATPVTDRGGPQGGEMSRLSFSRQSPHRWR